MIRFPPRRILVPFDFTGTALEAWRQAQSLAEQTRCPVTPLYVQEPPPAAAWEMAPFLAVPESRTAALERVKTALGSQVKARVELGDPATHILRVAKTLRPDLIVMGTHGRSGVERFWMGSVAEAVVRSSPVPVLTVRTEARPIKSVLAPVNFTDYSRHGFAYAAAVAAALGARLTVLHLAEPGYAGNPEFWMKNLVADLPEAVRHRCRPELLVKEGAVADEITGAAADFDLVVLVAHKKSMVKDALIGTTAEQVLRRSPAPVLALPAPKETPYRHWKVPGREDYQPLS
jgi:nucleotide-binding universal stress UspA family protein